MKMKNKFNWKEYILYTGKFALIYGIIVLIVFMGVMNYNRNYEKKMIGKCIDTYGVDNVIIQYEDTPYKHKFNCTPKYTIDDKFVNVTGELK
jgi:hypothetical protein